MLTSVRALCLNDEDTVSFAYDSRPHVSLKSFQYLAQITSVNPFLPKCCHKLTGHPSINLSVGDIRRQIAAEWLEIAQWSQWRAYRKLPSLFSDGTITGPVRPSHICCWNCGMLADRSIKDIAHRSGRAERLQVVLGRRANDY